MPRLRVRPPKAERTKITAEISVELYVRMQGFLEEFGMVRNRFIGDAIEVRLKELCPKYAKETKK